MSSTDVREYEGDPNAWDAFVRAMPIAHFSHQFAWLHLVRELYGGDARHVAAWKGDVLVGVAPVMVRRVVGEGLVAYATPFADEGGVCASDPEIEAQLVECVREIGRQAGAAYLEVRARRTISGDYPCDEARVTLEMPLPAETDELWDSLSKNMRKKVRRAQRDGLVWEIGGSEHLRDFYRIYAANMHELGSPMHSKRFFERLFECFAHDALTVVVRVVDTGAIAAAAVSLQFGTRLSVLCAHSDRAFLQLFPNNLLYWALFEAAMDRGCSVADFGRSPRGTGIYEFKKSWHMEEHQLYYTKVPICKRPEVGDRREGFTYSLFRKVWPRVPLPIARSLGPRIWARLPI